MNTKSSEEFKEQNIVLKNRKTLEITGVKKIESLNPFEFIIYTVLGKMVVRGKDLEMQALDIDNGNLSITGLVRSIEYIEKIEHKKEKGFVSKLFK